MSWLSVSDDCPPGFGFPRPEASFLAFAWCFRPQQQQQQQHHHHHHHHHHPHLSTLAPLNSESNRWFFISQNSLCIYLQLQKRVQIYFHWKYTSFWRIIRKIKKIKHDLLKRGEKYEIHPWLNVPLLPPSNGDAKVMILSEGSHCRAIPHKYRMPMMGPKSGKPSKKKHPKQDHTEERHQPKIQDPSGHWISLAVYQKFV